MPDPNDILQLSCPRYQCLVATDSKTIDINISDYVPGKLKCELCGSELTTFQETNLDHELFGMRMKSDIIELKFRIKSDIFPNWVYSENHYVFSQFWERLEGQYANKPEFNTVIEQEINGKWVEVNVTCFR